MSQQGLRFTLEVDGQEPDIFAVVSFALKQDYSCPFTLEVDVASDSFRQTADTLLEKNATLTLWQGQTVLRYISGVIATFGTKENNGWQMLYRFVIHPPLWRCALRQNFRIFQQQDILTISDILLRENGVTDWTDRFNEDHPTREFCVQYGESDLAFLTRLWAEEGIFFFDRPSRDAPQQKLSLCDNVAGLHQRPDPITFNPNATTEATKEHISVFRYEATVSPSSVQSQDYTFKVPDWPGIYDHEADSLNGQRAQYEIFDYPGRFKDEQHGQNFTRYKMEGWRSGAETAVCESNSPGLWPGTRFTLAGHPSVSLNREWQVTSSSLTGIQPQAQHGSQGAGTSLTNHFTVIPAERTWRARPQHKPKVDGPQSAVVTGPDGEEIFCDEHGRIRVKFLWDRYHGGTEDSSCWIRVSQAWAGTGFGNLAIPRVGQEVIVDFLNGDPDQPIVMGRTYHEDNRSPGDLPDTKTKMTIRSKTYKGDGFNELSFEDATGQEQVYIHAQKNMDTQVLNNRTTDVKVDHTETIGGNQSITVGVGQTVKVGDKKESGHDQSITIANDQNITVDNDQIVTVKNDQKLDVTHNHCKDVGNDQNSKVAGNDTENVMKSQAITVGENYLLTVTDSLTIQVGECLLKMNKDGTITLNGKSIQIEGKDKINIFGADIDLD